MNVLLSQKMQERDTPAWKLFHYRYTISTPNGFMIDVAQAEAYGSFTSGDRDRDMHAMQSYGFYNLTIPEIIELIDIGAPVILDNPNDRLKMRPIIRDHLALWDAYFVNNTWYMAGDMLDRLNRVKADLEALRLFDQRLEEWHRLKQPMHSSSEFLRRIANRRSGVKVQGNADTRPPVAIKTNKTIDEMSLGELAQTLGRTR